MRADDGRQRWDSDRLLRLLIRLAVNAVAIWIASRIVPGITPLNDLVPLLIVALIFGVVNALIKPVLDFVTCPIQLLTLGLFTLVINAVMFGITSWVAGLLNVPFHVDGIVATFLGALVVTIVSWLLSHFV